MEYRKTYFRIHSRYQFDSGWLDESDATEFREETRRLFQSAGWDLHPDGDSTSDTVTKGQQDLYLHPMNFSGIIEVNEIPALQALMKEAETFQCYGVDCYERYWELTDEEYLDDDIVSRLCDWLKVVYGADTLEANLDYIAKALGNKGSTSREIIRNYFLNDFYADHCKIYQKRPIYWLFDSGKKNGFKALIYMHRYQPDTIARIRTDYVHEQQARYRTAIADLEQRIANASTGERVKLNRKLARLQAQDTELRNYEEKIHHLADQMISIELDDGVKKNYAIFQDVLAKIK